MQKELEDRDSGHEKNSEWRSPLLSFSAPRSLHTKTLLVLESRARDTTYQPRNSSQTEQGFSAAYISENFLTWHTTFWGFGRLTACWAAGDRRLGIAHNKSCQKRDFAKGHIGPGKSGWWRRISGGTGVGPAVSARSQLIFKFLAVISLLASCKLAPDAARIL